MIDNTMKHRDYITPREDVITINKLQLNAQLSVCFMLQSLESSMINVCYVANCHWKTWGTMFHDPGESEIGDLDLPCTENLFKSLCLLIVFMQFIVCQMQR